MPTIANITVDSAIVLIAISGLLLVLQQHGMAVRLLLSGCTLAVASGLILGREPFAQAIVLISALGLVGAFLGFRRWPYFLIAYALVAALGLVALMPLVAWLQLHWWVIAALVVAGGVTAAIVMITVPALHESIYRADPADTLVRFLERFFVRLFGTVRVKRGRGPRIQDFDLRRRAGRGSGPNTI